MTESIFEPFDEAVDEAGPEVLELIDLDPQQLIDSALATVSDRFPGWQPREGNTEVVLIEALAREAMELVYAINEVPNALLEQLLGLYGLQRDQGAAPSTSLTFTVATSPAPRTIPAGTSVLFGDTDEETASEGAVLVTDEDLLIPAGQTSGTVSASALEADEAPNGIPAGTNGIVLDALTFVQGVRLAAVIAGGSPAEDQAAFMARGANVFARLNAALVRPSEVSAFVAGTVGVAKHQVLDLYDPTRPTITPGNAPGYVTVAVAGPDGASLSTGQLGALTDQLRQRMHAGLRVRAVNANVTTVDVRVTVMRYPAASPADVEAAVAARVRSYLDPQLWPWTRTVRINELIAASDQANGVDAVLGVVTALAGAATSDNTDKTLAGVAPLARAGTVIVEVVDP